MPQKTAKYEKTRNLFQGSIIAFAQYDAMTVFEQLKVGAQLTLRAEPDNPRYPDAVAVLYGETMLGYLGTGRDSEISKLLYFGHGGALEAIINRQNPLAGPDEQIGVVVRLKDFRPGRGQGAGGAPGGPR